MPGHLKNGFSLVEMLIALAVSSIIIAASFGSYTIIARNFEFQKDMKYIAQSARAVVDMMNADIRLAGYTAINNTSINDPVLLSDSGAADCCDAISVIYDQSQTQRRQVTYWTEQFIPGGGTADPTRNRLYKQVCNISNPYTIAQIQAGGCTSNILEKNPIADYVQDLQFTGSRGNCEIGSIKAGCGTKKFVKPSIVQEPSSGWAGAKPNCGGNINALQDGDWNNPWTCDLPVMGHVLFIATFSDKIRLLKFNWSNAAHINGGSLATAGWPPTSAQFPYATVHPITHNFIVHMNAVDAECSTDTCLMSNFVGNRLNTYTQCYGLLNLTDTNACQIDFEPFAVSGGNINGGGNGESKIANYATNRLYLALFDGDDIFCSYTAAGQPCNPVAGAGVSLPANRNRKSIAEMTFYVEEFGEAVTPHEIETSILIRSPNEHGNVDRSVGSPLTLGNRTNTWNDKRLRDSYTISTVVRNLFYASQ